jgi:hypothetical protein
MNKTTQAIEQAWAKFTAKRDDFTAYANAWETLLNAIIALDGKRMDAKFFSKINPPEMEKSTDSKLSFDERDALCEAYYKSITGIPHFWASVSYSSVKMHCSIRGVEDREYNDIHVFMKGSYTGEQPTVLQATTTYRADIIADITRRIEAIRSKIATMDETTHKAFTRDAVAYIEAKQALKEADNVLATYDHYARKEVTEMYID